MKEHLQRIWWVVGMVILLVGGSGCNQLEFDEDDLTFPIQLNGGQFTNFYVGERISEQFEWSHNAKILCINVPKAGDYLLTYATKPADNSWQTMITTPETGMNAFTIVFRASAPAQLYIGFRAREMLDYFTLERGTVKDEAVGLYDDGPIIRYASPTVPTIFWNDVFTLLPNSPAIEVIKTDSACPPPIASN